jgi:methyltransferase (TIGR00027 family)
MSPADLSPLMHVTELRHIQSRHETAEYRNPDSFVKHFLPRLRRLHFSWLSRERLTAFRSDSFYYYLVARTRYYDAVLVNAVSDDVGTVINVGCGNDTRAYRFERQLVQKGVTVLECDQPMAIHDKRRMARRLKPLDYTAYVPLDLNDDAWPDFELRLSQIRQREALVMMEGVSPYIDAESFGRFLGTLAKMLPAGSRVVYDFKFRGVADDFGRQGRTRIPFRLPAEPEDIAGYHEARGYRLHHVERSSDLSVRLLPGLTRLGAPLFTQDGLVELEVA